MLLFLVLFGATHFITISKPIYHNQEYQLLKKIVVDILSCRFRKIDTNANSKAQLGSKKRDIINPVPARERKGRTSLVTKKCWNFKCTDNLGAVLYVR